MPLQFSTRLDVCISVKVDIEVDYCIGIRKGGGLIPVDTFYFEDRIEKKLSAVASS